MSGSYESKEYAEKESEIETKRVVKKPYNKPSFRYEKVFETMALTCGKLVSEGACHFNRKTS